MDLPRTDSLVAHPNDEVSWAWPDGHLHPEPPLPVALVFFSDAGQIIPAPWYVAVEAPPCGALRDVRAEQAKDGQRRRFVCDKPAGHPFDWNDCKDEASRVRHRAVTDNDKGEAMTWPPSGASHEDT